MIEKIRPSQLYGKQPLATIAMKINELVDVVNSLVNRQELEHKMIIAQVEAAQGKR
jgi:hypothetical protein